MATSSTMPPSKPNPSEASTRPAKAICAAVLIFETISGLAAIGFPSSHASITAPTIMMSRDTTRMTSGRGTAPLMPSVT